MPRQKIVGYKRDYLRSILQPADIKASPQLWAAVQPCPQINQDQVDITLACRIGSASKGALEDWFPL